MEAAAAAACPRARLLLRQAALGGNYRDGQLLLRPWNAPNGRRGDILHQLAPAFVDVNSFFFF